MSKRPREEGEVQGEELPPTTKKPQTEENDIAPTLEVEIPYKTGYGFRFTFGVTFQKTPVSD